MRRSYEKHRRLAIAEKKVSPEEAHKMAIFGALGTRKLVRGELKGLAVPDVVIWPETTPFLNMAEDLSVEALCEYVVFEELPDQARIDWLKKAVSDAMSSCRDLEEAVEFFGAATDNGASWPRLLPDELRQELNAKYKSRSTGH